MPFWQKCFAHWLAALFELTYLELKSSPGIFMYWGGVTNRVRLRVEKAQNDPEGRKLCLRFRISEFGEYGVICHAGETAYRGIWSNQKDFQKGRQINLINRMLSCQAQLGVSQRVTPYVANQKRLCGAKGTCISEEKKGFNRNCSNKYQLLAAVYIQ